MSSQYRISESKRQIAQERATTISHELEMFLNPLLTVLDAYVDQRLVRTFLQTIQAIVQFRNQSQGLLVSELGSYIEKPAQAIAGSKKLHRLLSSKKWAKDLIEDFLWEEAAKRYYELKQEGQQILFIHDGSVIEKPESEHLEGLSAVKSSKAARLKKLRKGVFNQPSRPIVVKGVHWTGGIVVGMSGKPTLAAMKWWNRSGEMATSEKLVEEYILRKSSAYLGKDVIHIFDRGYGSGPWLRTMERCQAFFVIRWKKGHKFFDAEGNEKTLVNHTRYKKSLEHRMIWDNKKGEDRKTGILFMPIRHASYAMELWVVVIRRGGEPWYLITNQRIETKEQAWECYKQYGRRWQVETVFRQAKSELGIETARLFKEQKREKLWGMVSLVHAFLLRFCGEGYKELRDWLLQQYCHRTGKKQREAKVPFYRVRWALSRLWEEFHPIFSQASIIHPRTSESSGMNVGSNNSG